MRIIVRCQECRRQYNAAGQAPGKRFRCQCGAALTVPEPTGHDASVVRCSSCAAPRQDGAANCPHCGSDFTLHERDLHTVCPNCFARVSDRARYCHHCAQLLSGEELSLEATDHFCPVCSDEKALSSRSISAGLPEVLECSSCAGMWLSIASMEHLIDYEATREQSGRRIGQASQLAIDMTPQEGPAYRPCIVCQTLMMRRNFGRGDSNVIVDICRLHGVWFDANELAALLRWIRSGGIDAAQQELARLQRDVNQRRRDARARSGTGARTSGDNSDDDDPRWSNIGGGGGFGDFGPSGDRSSLAVLALESLVRLFNS